MPYAQYAYVYYVSRLNFIASTWNIGNSYYLLICNNFLFIYIYNINNFTTVLKHNIGTTGSIKICMQTIMNVSVLFCDNNNNSNSNYIYS